MPGSLIFCLQLCNSFRLGSQDMVHQYIHWKKKSKQNNEKLQDLLTTVFFTFTLLVYDCVLANS